MPDSLFPEVAPDSADIDEDKPLPAALDRAINLEKLVALPTISTEQEV